MSVPDAAQKPPQEKAPLGFFPLLSAWNSEMMPEGTAALWQPAGKTNVKDSKAGSQEESGLPQHPGAAGPAWLPVYEHLVIDEK